MINFKKGNTVKVIGRNATLNSKIKYGDTRTVTDTCADMVQLDSISDGWVYECNIELAEDISKPVTEEYEGNVYELDKHYLFGNSHQLHKLLRIDKLSDFPFRIIDNTHENGFKSIHLVNLDEGTITPAPIELIDGNAYMFDYESKQTIGLYYKLNDMFYMADFSLSVKKCTNIRPMTVAESK
jgi:hypothetical protein